MSAQLAVLLAIFLTALLVAPLTVAILTIRENAKLLASRSFSEYAAGEQRLARASKDASGQNPDEGYALVWKEDT